MGTCGDLLILWCQGEALDYCKFPLPVKPASCQSGVAVSFFGLSLSSVYRGQFANQQRVMKRSPLLEMLHVPQLVNTSVLL